MSLNQMVGQMVEPPDPIDGFLYSTTLRLLPSQSRANCLAQIELLRKARGYKCRMYCAPDPSVLPIAAYSQIEHQVKMAPGTYVWGLSVWASSSTSVKFQMTDECTEIPFFDDYVPTSLFQQLTTGAASTRRAPSILTQPRLIDSPGHVNVELYNDSADAVNVQVVLYCAEPVIPNPDIREGRH